MRRCQYGMRLADPPKGGDAHVGARGYDFNVRICDVNHKADGLHRQKITATALQKRAVIF